MNIPKLAILRPVFTTSLFLLTLGAGFLSLKKLPVDLFPNVTYPVVQVTTLYPGAGPKEIEELVSKPIEDEVSTVSGIKTLRSESRDSVSVVIAAFDLATPIQQAEQQIRDKVASVRRRLPSDIKEPVVSRLDPANRPILQLALSAPLPEAELFDLADQQIRPKLEQVKNVGLIEIIGGRKREIWVELDRDNLNLRDLPASLVASRLSLSGKNIPAGRVDYGQSETSFRVMGEFTSLEAIENQVISFPGNDVGTRVKDVGKVTDTLAEEKSQAFLNGKQALVLSVYKQSGTNTIAVADAVISAASTLERELKQKFPDMKLEIVEDNSKFIRDNVADVNEAIWIGIALTFVVVFFFLGSVRSTVITGLALPNSLLGAFVLMALSGFSINVMTLLGLSLAVGLLIDDAIVVRENIFRHTEMGVPPREAAEKGTNEVLLAVVATTLAVLAVFGPISFIDGVVGQFFKEFGLTICFAMAISFLDAITMAPMLSAYVGKGHGPTSPVWDKTLGRALRAFDKFQSKLEDLYESALRFTLRRPVGVLAFSAALFVLSLGVTRYIPKVFLPPQDFGQFDVELELSPGTTLSHMSETALQVENRLRQMSGVKSVLTLVGDREGEPNRAILKVHLVPRKERTQNTSEFKEAVRKELQPFAHAHPRVKDIDFVGSGLRPFNINFIGDDLEELQAYTAKVGERLQSHPSLKDLETSYQPGKPEFRIALDSAKAQELGIVAALAGQELRTQLEGTVPAVFRSEGREYDIRVRVGEKDRDLQAHFSKVRVPNQNHSMVYLKQFAKLEPGTGPAAIHREDRGRYIRLSADMNPKGPGMAALMKDIETWLKTDLRPPTGVRTSYVGDAENFTELTGNMMLASILGILFIYLVLASLYESWVTPLTILLVLPLAATGAFFGLLTTGKSLDLFSMIGSVLLLGIATKNSILLVDYTKKLVDEGMEMGKAIVLAGRTRLRPILMTSFALIAGMLPVAVGLNEASRQRVSMGIAVIGGLVSSTLLTLVVVPAAFVYIERFRAWATGRLTHVVGQKPQAQPTSEPSSVALRAVLDS